MPQFLQFLYNLPGFAQLTAAWLFLKILFILADATLLFLLLWSVYEAWKFRPHLELHEEHTTHAMVPVLRKDVVQKRWQQLLTKASDGSPDSARIGVIEADALTGEVLKMLGVKGAHIADQLQTFDAAEVKTLERVWRAHRLRNDLVHTPGFYVSPEDAQKTIQDYHSFLVEIDAI